MKSLPIAFVAVAFLATAATAQTTDRSSASNPVAGPLSNTTQAGVGSKMGTTPMTGVRAGDNGPAAPGGAGDKAAASGNDNQAVATTNANAQQPAHGANSFSRSEAQGRIQDEGFQKVSNLHKGHDGVWRGKGMKNGEHVRVWLDYKGNVGQM